MDLLLKSSFYLFTSQILSNLFNFSETNLKKNEKRISALKYFVKIIEIIYAIDKHSDNTELMKTKFIFIQDRFYH